MRRTAVATLVAGVLCGLAQPGADGAQQPVFRTGTDLVTFAVTVTNRRETFVTDLIATDFEILEDGRPQTVKYFAIGDGGAAPELHVGLLLDTSGSMADGIDLARSAAVRFLTMMSDARDITLVDFDTEVRVARYGQDDFPRVVERIRSRKPRGFTAMYDAVGVFLDGAQSNNGRTILVVLTDGGDTRSATRFTDLVTLIRASNPTIYSVGLLQHQPAGARAEQRLRLTQIANESGGEAFFPASMKEVEQAYDRIAAQVRAQYHLGFVSTNQATDGKWRKVDVRVTRPDGKDWRVRTRKGYFAPYAR